MRVTRAQLEDVVQGWLAVGRDCGLPGSRLDAGARFIRTHWWATRGAGCVAEYTEVVSAMLEGEAA